MTDLRRHVPPMTLHWDDEAPGAAAPRRRRHAGLRRRLGLHRADRAARRGSGRIGAEEIVETLNRVFGPMLRHRGGRGAASCSSSAATRCCSSSAGEGHPEQACDAAVEMRAALRAGGGGARRRSGGSRLSMSVGVHSGDVDLFLVGAPTRELLVLGPAATATAQAEKAAEAGQIVVSADRPPAGCPGGSTRPRDDGALLLRRRSPRTTRRRRRTRPDADRDRAVDAVPARARRVPRTRATGPRAPRRRRIAFVRFSGTDALLRGAGPAGAGRRPCTSSSRRSRRRSRPRASPCWPPTSTPTAASSSSAPACRAPSEDDEGRMLRALRRIADAGPPLPLQLGVNRATSSPPRSGVAERAAYSAMGDTTNTAARIMSHGAAGVDLRPPRGARALPDPVRRRAGRAVPDEGQGRCRCSSTRSARRSGPAKAVGDARLPFLGRDEEIATVRRALDGRPGRRRRCHHRRRRHRAWASHAWSHEALERRPPAPDVWSSGPSRTVRRAPTGCCATRCATLLGDRAAAPARRMGAALLPGLSAGAPDLLPMAPLLADVVPGRGARPRRRPTGSTRSSAPTGSADVVIDAARRASCRGRWSCVVEEAHWADGASAAPPRPDRGRHGGPALGGRRGAARGDRRFRPGIRRARGRCTRWPRRSIERLVIAATEATPLRPHEVAAIVDARRGEPALRRGGHPASPWHRARWTRCRSPSTPR